MRRRIGLLLAVWALALWGCKEVPPPAAPKAPVTATAEAKDKGKVKVSEPASSAASRPATSRPAASSALSRLASPTSRPVIKNTGVIVGGPYAKAALRRVIVRHASELRRCYERTLSRSPRLHNRLVVRFTIKTNGKCASPSIVSSTFSDRKVGSCVLKAMRRWRFPQPAGGGDVVITYPFVFRSGG